MVINTFVRQSAATNLIALLSDTFTLFTMRVKISKRSILNAKSNTMH